MLHRDLQSVQIAAVVHGRIAWSAKCFLMEQKCFGKPGRAKTNSENNQKNIALFMMYF